MKTETTIVAALCHYRDDLELPAGRLKAADLPRETRSALERLQKTLQTIPKDDIQQLRSAVQDPESAMDANLDAPHWSLSLVMPDGTRRSFQVTEETGRPDVEAITSYLKEALPVVDTKARRAIVDEIENG